MQTILNPPPVPASEFRLQKKKSGRATPLINYRRQIKIAKLYHRKLLGARYEVCRQSPENSIILLTLNHLFCAGPAVINYRRGRALRIRSQRLQYVVEEA
ncbi:TPA: hypothetical protein DD394_05780 [bacterium UBP9_UBA11836]|nr:hypothetical protein [bacterium UBP9_UBA11836]